MLTTLKQRLNALPPVIWVLLLTVGCVAPFIGKAFHIDDTLFLRVAEQIQKHPLDFFGFKMNWFGTTRPMIENFDNPPLACYYIAAVTWLAGWSEPVLHLAFLLPALAVAWGVFSLAKNHSSPPILTAAVAILTPVFVISSATVMCDVLLLAFWLWAVILFERGLENNQLTNFFACGMLVGLAFSTKFTGVALIPLLGIYGFCRQRRPAQWLIALLLPLLFVIAYEWMTRRLYGKSLFLSAARYSSQAGGAVFGGALERQAIGLSYLGGCFFPILFYAPWLWNRRELSKAIGLLLPALILPLVLAPYQRFVWPEQGHLDWLVLLQSALFLAGGLHILLLGFSDFWHRRDPFSLLLLLWVLGIFVFATAINWTINGRTLLVMLPAVGILVARRLALHLPATTSSEPWRLACPLLAAAAFSLAIGKADCDLANTGRQAAQDLCAKYQLPRKTLWFEGHWGFQYYMERQGAQPLQRIFGLPNPGDMLVLPAQAVNFFDVSRDLVRLVDRLEYVPNPYCSTMSRSAGAGFYAAYAGPFPYSVGHIPSERYYVFQVTQTLATAIRAPGGLSEVGALEQQLEHERTNRAVRQTPKAQTDRIFDWPTRKRSEIELAGGLSLFANPTP